MIDSLLDIIASIINFFVIRQALKPADADHRFGHGKAEALGGLSQTMFIAGSALWLLVEALHRFIQPHYITDIGFASVITLISIGLTTSLVMLQKYVVRKTNSLTIAADSLHYQTDLFTNIGVLIGLYLAAKYNLYWLDTVIGVTIAIYILITSYKIGYQSLNILMDKELDEPLRQQIIHHVYKHPDVLGVHDLRTRSAGQQIFIQMHLDLDAKITLKQAHDIGFAVASHLREHFPHADVIIHQDPISQ